MSYRGQASQRPRKDSTKQTSPLAVPTKSPQPSTRAPVRGDYITSNRQSTPPAPPAELLPQAPTLPKPDGESNYEA